MKEERNDFFVDADVPEKPKPEKKPVYKRDDPRYWDQPEDEFEHLRPSASTGRKIFLLSGVIIVLLILCWWGYSWMFSPYVEQGTQYGYVESIDKRGDLFKTYEGVMLPYKSLMDTSRSYEKDFAFSTKDPGLAAKLSKMMFANRPVKIRYEIYRSRMPWRGDSRVIVTGVDSVDPSLILPPDRVISNQPVEVEENR